jgi:hypothetical protein
LKPPGLPKNYIPAEFATGNFSVKKMKMDFSGKQTAKNE